MQNSRFGVGMNHIVEVLTGADTDKIRRWGHDRLTTYGIGKELARPQWAAVGRELMRLGYVTVAEGEYATLELTTSGLNVLLTRTPITLTKPMNLPKAKRVAVRREGEIACDEILFERLRVLRKNSRTNARFRPTSFRRHHAARDGALLSGVGRQMEGIPGVGEKKRAEFGEVFAREIASYLKTNSRQAFE